MAEEVILGEADGVVAVVVDHEDLDRKVVGQNRLQLLQVHHDGTVALEADGFFASAADAGADGRRQAIAHAGNGAVVGKAGAVFNHIRLMACDAAGAVGNGRQAALRQTAAHVADKGVDIGRAAVFLPLAGQNDRILLLPALAGFIP